jgi:hypothetical protein
MTYNNTNNKSTPLTTWSSGELKITEWEKYNKNNIKYLQYSISKTVYEKPKNKGEKGIDLFPI